VLTLASLDAAQPVRTLPVRIPRVRVGYAPTRLAARRAT
jgi:hypothetical protein